MVAMVTVLLDKSQALLQLAQRATLAYDRPDLSERLALLGRRVEDPRVRVLVVGEFKHGKSSVINALLGLEVCPIDDDVATSVPTVVQWAPELRVEAVFRVVGDTPMRRQEVPVGDLACWVTEDGNAGNKRDLALVEVGLPATLLQDGLALVDTPGVGGFGSVHNALTLATLPLADAVVFATSAAQELTQAELAFLRSVVALCPNVLVVSTKIDLYPQWRTIHDLDGAHVAEAGLTVDHLAASSALRELAIEGDDRAANDESGFPGLVRWLRNEVALADVRRTARSVAVAVDDVAVQLRARFAGERLVLGDPGACAEIVADLDGARERADRVRAAGARWQQLLSDGFTDASAAIDVDLRTRLRDLTAKGEEMIDGLDPAVAWAEFEPWLYREVSSSISDHLILRHRQLAELAEGVSEAFGEDASTPPVELVADTSAGVGAVGVRARLELKRMGVGGQALSLLRGSYGGIAMFGALGGLAGIVVSLPAVVGVGLLLGGKGLREEKQRQLVQRRAQAKVSLRHYLDAATFALLNDQRDTLRAVQRALRDHYSTRAAELARSARQALDAATAASTVDAAERDARLAFIERELAKIAVVAQRAEALAAAANEPAAEDGAL